MKFGMRCKYFCWTLHHDGEFALALPKPLSKGAGEVLVGTHQLWQGSVQGLFQCPLGMTSTSRTTCNPTSWVTSASGSGGLSTTRLDVTSLSTCLVRIISHFPLPLIFFYIWLSALIVWLDFVHTCAKLKTQWTMHVVISDVQHAAFYDLCQQISPKVRKFLSFAFKKYFLALCTF